MVQLFQIVVAFAILVPMLTGLALFLVAFRHGQQSKSGRRLFAFGFMLVAFGFEAGCFLQSFMRGVYPLDYSIPYAYSALSWMLLIGSWSLLRYRSLRPKFQFSLAGLMLLTFMIAAQMAMHASARNLGEMCQRDFRRSRVAPTAVSE